MKKETKVIEENSYVFNSGEDVIALLKKDLNIKDVFTKGEKPLALNMDKPLSLEDQYAKEDNWIELEDSKCISMFYLQSEALDLGNGDTIPRGKLYMKKIHVEVIN